ncbi:ABC transporter ATP-binding protein [Clostridium chrysemydis]|uniref:ABC transporter ATP-binding protein n=1 Tax=Clostridium chrysemydis TaxID=2665504 RepID=UPI0018834A98|nr:ABC transporter ATP-binding protein [Clostridium chrysemydis]
MSIINIKGVNKIYGKDIYETYALKNIDLKVESGDMIAIMGTSGSGKSTLLNIIGMIDKATKGEYKLLGKEVKNLNIREVPKLRNKTIGFIFQEFNLLNNQDIVYNTMIPLLYSNNKKKMKERCIEALNSVGLSKHLHKTPNELSGGQKQRVAIARAIVNKPTIILADEPTGALDKKTSEEILNIFQNLNNEGQTIIIVTHDIDVANRCKRIINIVDGEIK